jgi:hypothetical protein
MSPEQITEKLDEIAGQVADAWIMIYDLEKMFEAAKLANPAVDVVYGDVWSDLGLATALSDLRRMERKLVDGINLYLSEHFDRLRRGEP